jgi:alcohol dehydrogenase class IV
MESAWAAAATKESVEISIRALGQAWSNLQTVVETPSPENRREMAEASTAAGAAIAIAKTTACHALSYHLTAVYGVSHGVAVAITLGPLLAFNAGVDESDVSGERSPEEIRAAIARVCDAIGAEGPEAALAAIQSRLRSLDVPTSLADLGLGTPDRIAALIESVNRERLANNPRFVSPGDLAEILRRVA